MKYLTTLLVALLLAVPAGAEWNRPGKADENRTGIQPGQSLIWVFGNATGTTDTVYIGDCGSWRLHTVLTDVGALVSALELCSEDEGGTLRCGTALAGIDGSTLYGLSGSSPAWKLRMNITTCGASCAGVYTLSCGN